jgi:signal transduction histidine kinase
LTAHSQSPARGQRTSAGIGCGCDGGRAAVPPRHPPECSIECRFWTQRHLEKELGLGSSNPTGLIGVGQTGSALEILEWWPLPLTAVAATALMLHLLGRRHRHRWQCLGVLIAQHAALLALLWSPRPTYVTIGAPAILLLGYIRWFMPARRPELDAESAPAAGAAKPADAALGELRRRLARDLHNTVGNNLTVISLHARAGSRIQPDRRLALIDEVAQQTMHQMGGIVRVLRGGAEAVEEEPSGLMAATQRAFHAVRGLGPPIRLRFTGAEVYPPAGVRRLVRQVVNEALINGLKHGPLQEASVELNTDDDIDLRVLTRRGERGCVPRGVVGLGLGLPGLAEEVHNYGGAMHSGPLVGAWFCVHVRIPLVWTRPAPGQTSRGIGVTRLDIPAAS